MSFTVLMYHELRETYDWKGNENTNLVCASFYRDRVPVPLFTDVADFKKQMIYLKENHYSFLTMHDVRKYYEEGTFLPPRSVMITFDDAFQSVFEYAYPVLKQLDIRATLFVVSGWVYDKPTLFARQQSKVMSWHELESMGDVFDFANHTHALHVRDASNKSMLLKTSEASLFADLKRCDRYVTQHDTFAYPFGEFDDAVIAKLKQWGIRYAFTTQTGINNSTTDPLKLHRNLVYYGCPLDAFVEMLPLS